MDRVRKRSASAVSVTRFGKHRPGIAVQRVTRSEWAERNRGRRSSRGDEMQEVGNKQSGCEVRRKMSTKVTPSRSPEIPFLSQRVKKKDTSSQCKPIDSCYATGNLESNITNHCEGVAVKINRNKMKSKFRKQVMHDLVLEQMKQMIKENEQVRKRLQQCSQKVNDGERTQ